MEGYAINEKRMFALQKTVNIQTKMLAYSLDLEEKEILKAVNQYTEALLLLDQYDHFSKMCILGKLNSRMLFMLLIFKDILAIRFQKK